APDPYLAHAGVFQEMGKVECHFISGTERVRLLERHSYNREQYLHFDSDVGIHVGDTPNGEKVTRYWDSDQEWMEYQRCAVDTYCRHSYEVFRPFSVDR
ncbi:HB2L protein, partial [Mionectes macconnelli]|nr:HB2L protein [Mionectes macconnelli]